MTRGTPRSPALSSTALLTGRALKAGMLSISSASSMSCDLTFDGRAAARAEERRSGALAAVGVRCAEPIELAEVGVFCSVGAPWPRKRFGVLVKSCTCSPNVLEDGEERGLPSDPIELRGDEGAEPERGGID